MTDLDQRGATGPAIYRGMDRPTLDAAYNNSAAVADSPEWLARWRERSAIVRASPGARLDIVYGPRSRARLDYFPCGKRQAPLFVFIHAAIGSATRRKPSRSSRTVRARMASTSRYPATRWPRKCG